LKKKSQKMDNNPNHEDIISNSVAGLINLNLDENNMREVLLSGNLKTHYTCKISIKMDGM